MGRGAGPRHLQAFIEADGPYDQPTAKRLRATIMSVGDTVEPARRFRDLRGCDPKVAAVLRDRGVPAPPRSGGASPKAATR